MVIVFKFCGYFCADIKNRNSCRKVGGHMRDNAYHAIRFNNSHVFFYAMYAAFVNCDEVFSFVYGIVNHLGFNVFKGVTVKGIINNKKVFVGDVK